MKIFLGQSREYLPTTPPFVPNVWPNSNLAALAQRDRDFDFSYRPRKDGFAMRLWNMQAIDNGNMNKGTLAGWGVDRRDPAG